MHHLCWQQRWLGSPQAWRARGGSLRRCGARVQVLRAQGGADVAALSHSVAHLAQREVGRCPRPLQSSWLLARAVVSGPSGTATLRPHKLSAATNPMRAALDRRRAGLRAWGGHRAAPVQGGAAFCAQSR